MSAQVCKTVICSNFALYPDDDVTASVKSVMALSPTEDVDDTWRAKANGMLDKLLQDRETLSGNALKTAEDAFVTKAKAELFEPLFPPAGA